MKLLFTCLSFTLLFVLSGTDLYAQNNAMNIPSGSWVDCGSNSALYATNIKTMECWIKFGNLSNDQEIMSRSIAGVGIEMLIYGGNLAMYCMKDGTNYAFTSYPMSNFVTGVWYHIASTWDGTTGSSLAIYVNGIKVSGTPTTGGSLSTGITNPTGTFKIGDWSDPTHRYLIATVEEARVWSTNRTAAQIKAGMYGVATNSAGLIAYYQFNEASGAAVNATGVTALNGTLNGTAARVASPVQSASNMLNFDGVDDVVVAPAKGVYDLTTGTVELWAQPSSLGTVHQTLFGVRGASGSRYSFHMDASHVGMWNSGGYLTLSYTFTNNTWYHMTFVMTSSSTEVYVNGVDIGAIPEGPGTTTGQQLRIGGTETTGENFGGNLEEVRLWNYAFTPAQVTSSMNATLTGSETGLIAWYPMDQGIGSGANAGLTNLIDFSPTNSTGVLTNFALSGATSNYALSTIVTLPVTFGYFKGAPSGDKVLLSWQTAQEENSRNFVIERSTDNQHFSELGTVAASGNSSVAITYQYTDNSPAAGSNYYRIREVDLDGRSMYSTTVQVAFRAGTGVGLRAYPNPARETLNYVVSGLSGAGEVLVTDMSGRLMLSRSVQLGLGANSLETGSLPAGSYLLRVVPATGSPVTQQFQVVR
ncbi:MAG: T9SS type A sorting domain-containing protein [Bacteroidetes bacterium]|nr:T9SS type A sorting domain-containing protein [Bacteroidota bacterium]